MIVIYKIECILHLESVLVKKYTLAIFHIMPKQNILPISLVKVFKSLGKIGFLGSHNGQ